MADEKPRPEQTFFADPALDRMFGWVVALSGEVFVLRDRMRCLERILADKGVMAADALDRYVPTPEEEAENRRDRDAFVAALMENLLGEQKSKGAA